MKISLKEAMDAFEQCKSAIENNSNLNAQTKT